MEPRRLIDMHTHVYTPGALAFMQDYIKRSGLEALSIASFGCGLEGCCPEENILPLIFKQKENAIYAYGSLIYPEAPCGALNGFFAPREQALRLLAMGCDGMKMLESKPDTRKMLGLALDDEILEPFFSLLEETGTPLLWHVADPPEFWDKDQAPSFAVEAGWTYDGTFLPWEESIGEALHVLARHKGLKAILAHFFFHSHYPERAEQVMRDHPCVSFDLTPGIEMYTNFSAARGVWREFFIRHADRILFGTDADEFCADIMCETEKDPVVTVRHMRRFLETDDAFRFWGRPVQGLKLPDEVLDKIYFENFYRLFPKRKMVDPALLKSYAEATIGRVHEEETRQYIRRELELNELLYRH
ncbi:MAG: amidohydrolase family protein [Lachnospiraceae bacterium]|nr:amidohydrolase family protein [Lachnospiraceae bacterium]